MIQKVGTPVKSHKLLTLVKHDIKQTGYNITASGVGQNPIYDVNYVVSYGFNKLINGFKKLINHIKNN